MTTSKTVWLTLIFQIVWTCYWCHHKVYTLINIMQDRSADSVVTKSNVGALNILQWCLAYLWHAIAFSMYHVGSKGIPHDYMVCCLAVWYAFLTIWYVFFQNHGKLQFMIYLKARNSTKRKQICVVHAAILLAVYNC